MARTTTKKPAKRGRGQPTKLNAVVQRKVCAAIRKGMTLDLAAEHAGVGLSTFHRWMADGEQAEVGIYRDFREAVMKANAALAMRTSTVLTDMLSSKQEPAIRLSAAKFIASHRFARHFSPKSEVQATGPDGGPVQVQATVKVQPLVTDDQLAAASPAQLEAIIAGLVGRATGG